MAASTPLWSAVDVESFINEYYGAWSGTDEDRIMSYYAENVTLQIPGALMQGKEAVRDQFVRPFITAFPGNYHRVKNMIFGPGVVTVEWSFEAQHKGPFADHAATGARIKLPGCGVYEYDSAKRQITAGRIYFDVGTLLQTITDLPVNEKAAEALRSNGLNLSLTMNTIPTHIYVLNTEGSVQYVNQAVMDYTGLTLEDVQQGDYRDRVIHPEDFKRVRAGRAASLRRVAPFSTEQRVLGKEGQYRWFLVRYKPWLDEQGRIVRWYVAAFDIEDRKRAEYEREQSQEALKNALDQIQKSESKLRQVIDTIPALAWCNLPDGPNEFLNKGWHEYTGLSAEESHGWGWQATFHPEDLPPLMERWLKMLTTGEPDAIEARLRRHDGVYRWFLIRAEPLRDEFGKIVRWYGTSTDIEDRKQAEALLAEEKRLLEMVASGCSLADVLDALCRFVEDMASGCYCSIYLIDPSSTKFHNAAAPSLPSSFNDPVEGAPVDSETGPCGMAACLKTQVIAPDIASDSRWPTSAFRPLALAHGLRSCSSTPILSLAGDVLGTFAIYQNEPGTPTPLQQELIARFTHIASIAIEGARSEAVLKRSEAFLAEAQRVSKIGSFVTDLLLDEHNWSEELRRIFELNPGTRVTTEAIRALFHPEDLPIYEDAFKGAVDGLDRDIDITYRIITPAGNVKHLHAVAHILEKIAGRPVYIGAIQDVTESKVAEQALTRARAELAHMARVTTLSALTASIAHEINQPIAAVITSAGACLRWLNRDQPEVHRARDAAMRIEDDGKRAAEIITHLKSFYKKDVSPQREMVSVNDVVGEMLVLLRSEADRHSGVMRTELSADLPSVSADRVLLQQVLMNLMLNGIEAMSERGGELKISTRREGEEVMVSVSDTGMGIPADKMEEIFNAFVTTKAGGTGMGLAISRTIIESHGGRLWATVNPERGATFHFTLPTKPEAYK